MNYILDYLTIRIKNLPYLKLEDNFVFSVENIVHKIVDEHLYSQSNDREIIAEANGFFLAKTQDMDKASELSYNLKLMLDEKYDELAEKNNWFKRENWS